MPRKSRRVKKSTTDSNYEKVYARGEVGWGSRLIGELKKMGGKIDPQHPLYGNNPYYLYYIGKDGIIRFTDVDSPEAYFLLDSLEWEEITFKKEN